MKGSTNLLIVSLCCFVILAGRAKASTSCFVCTSATHDDCGEDDFSYISNALNMESDCEYCSKNVVGVLGANALVTRGCQEVCLPINSGFGPQMACCDSFLCNGATYIRPTAFVMATITCIVLLLVTF